MRFGLSRGIALAALWPLAVLAAPDDAPGKQPVESDFLRQPAEASLSSTPLIDRISTPAAIWLQLRNEKTAPITFHPPRIVAVSGPGGAVAADRLAIDTTGCPQTLAKGAACAAKLSVQPLWPGVYTVTVGVGGSDGGWSERDVTIKWRLSMPVAFLIAMAGLKAGVWIDSWRTRGRQVTDAALNLRRALEGLDAAPDHAGLREATAVLKRDVDLRIAEFEAGGVKEDEMRALIARCERLSQAGVILRAFAALDGDGKAAIGPRLEPLVRMFLSTTLTDEETGRLDALRESVAGGIRDWHIAARALGQGEALARGLADRAARLAAFPVLAGKLEDGALRVREAMARLRTLSAQEPGAEPPGVEKAVQAAAAVLGAVATDILDATGELAKLFETRDADSVADAGRRAGLRRRLAALTAIRPADPAVALDGLFSIADGALMLPDATMPLAAAAAEAATTPDAASFIKPIQVGFGISLLRSLDDLRALRRRNDRLVDIAMLTFGAIALTTTAATSPTWGAGVDMVTLFLLGVGVRVAVEAVRQ